MESPWKKSPGALLLVCKIKGCWPSETAGTLGRVVA